MNIHLSPMNLANHEPGNGVIAPNKRPNSNLDAENGFSALSKFSSAIEEFSICKMTDVDVCWLKPSLLVPAKTPVLPPSRLRRREPSVNPTSPRVRLSAQLTDSSAASHNIYRVMRVNAATTHARQHKLPRHLERPDAVHDVSDTPGRAVPCRGQL